jgi:hypothetical protein
MGDQIFSIIDLIPHRVTVGRATNWRSLRSGIPVNRPNDRLHAIQRSISAAILAEAN